MATPSKINLRSASKASTNDPGISSDQLAKTPPLATSTPKDPLTAPKAPKSARIRGAKSSTALNAIGGEGSGVQENTDPKATIADKTVHLNETDLSENDQTVFKVTGGSKSVKDSGGELATDIDAPKDPLTESQRIDALIAAVATNSERMSFDGKFFAPSLPPLTKPPPKITRAQIVKASEPLAEQFLAWLSSQETMISLKFRQTIKRWLDDLTASGEGVMCEVLVKCAVGACQYTTNALSRQNVLN